VRAVAGPGELPRRLACALVLAMFAALPLLGVGDYWLYVVTIGFYYALLAASWSLLVGYVGRISFAQAAMSGLGAYASVLTVTRLGLPLPIGIVLAVVASGLVGVVIGWLTLRLHGAYLGLTTIAFAEILRIAITAEHGFTRGSLGLPAPPLIPGGTNTEYYYALLALAVGSLGAMWLILRSRVGLFFQAIREDEDGAASLGVAVTAWKVTGFALSSAFAGLAGAFYAHTVELITPSMMSLQEMGLILAMAVVGGFHNVAYAALGGVLLQVLLEALREIGEWRLAMFGLLAILMLRFAPNGLFGLLGDLLPSRAPKRGAPVDAAATPARRAP
jgi:branched-chain amino acid transport system permease protein